MLLAFGLRVYALDGQSFWSDEGLSLYRASQPFLDVLANEIVVDGIVTQDTNPAFYFLLLYGWRQLTGDTVFALRFLGVLLATVAVPVIYFLGQTAFGRRAGLVAALLLALSPFHIWQSQILRNYGLLLTLNLLSVAGLLRFIVCPSAAGRKRWRWLVVWLVAGLGGIYTHYFGFFIFAFGVLALIVSEIRHWRLASLLGRRWLWLGLLLGGLLLLPVVPVAVSRFLAGRQVDFYPVSVPAIVSHGLSAFAVGVSPTVLHPWWRILPAALLALVGLVLSLRRRPLSALFSLGYQFVPLGLLLFLSLFNPLYNGIRHLLIGLPPFLLFIAAGITLPVTAPRASGRQRWRWLALPVAVLLLLSQGAWLWTQFQDPELVRDDVQGAAAYLSRVTRPEDVIVLHDTLIAFTFDYYYDGVAPVTPIPDFAERSLEQAVATLAAAGEEAERVWFLTEPTPRTGFPRRELARWAEANWPRFADRSFPWLWLPLQLKAYIPEPERETLPAEATPLGTAFGEAIGFEGVLMPAIQRAGEPWNLIFYLSRLQPQETTYTLSLQLRDEQGHSWAQVDRPLWRHYPPSAWTDQTLLRYDHLTQLPAGVPPGRYQVSLRLLDEQDQPVARADGQVELRLPDVTVTAASCDAPPATWLLSETRNVRFGRAVTLLGTSSLSEESRPGHPLNVQLLWCVRRQPEQDYGLRLQLVDENGEIVAESLSPFGPPGLSATALQAGQLVSSQASLVLPAAATDRPHRLRLSVVPAGQETPLAVNWLLGGRTLDIGEVSVVPWSLETAFPPIPSPLRADFGSPTLIELHGYEVEDQTVAPAEATGLTFFWRAAETISDNYRVFVHVVNSAEEIVAQVDGIPVHGLRPTMSWRAGEVIVDERTLSLPPSVPAGTYDLWIGWYDPENGQRLPIDVNGERQADDRLLLAPLTVAP